MGSTHRIRPEQDSDFVTNVLSVTMLCYSLAPVVWCYSLALCYSLAPDPLRGSGTQD